jgi:hypothetical protein
MTITQISSLSSNISVIAACGVAIYGVTAWRREHIGKQRIDLAEEVLALFYEARDAIQSIRSPVSFGGEGRTREHSGTETPEQKDARDRAYVVFERYKQYQDVFNRLNTIRYRYVAKFGMAHSQPFDELDLALKKVLIAARMLSQLWAERMREDASQERAEQYERRLEKYEKSFWAGHDENDEIEGRMQTAIEEIEKTARDIIDSPTIFTRIARRLHRRTSTQG